MGVPGENTDPSTTPVVAGEVAADGPDVLAGSEEVDEKRFDNDALDRPYGRLRREDKGDFRSSRRTLGRLKPNEESESESCGDCSGW